jgi:phosphoglucosamine mutase
MRNTGLKNYIEASGMKLEETAVGDRFVIERLVELRREFPGAGMIGLGGEQAGHLVLLDDEHVTGDGMRTALFLIRFFLESGASSLTQFADGVGKTPQIIASAHAVDEPRLSREKLAALEESTLRETPGLVRANLRYSGTEPLFRVMLESDGRRSESDLADIAVRLCRKVQSKREIEENTIDILNCTSGGVLVPRNDPA